MLQKKTNIAFFLILWIISSFHFAIYAGANWKCEHLQARNSAVKFGNQAVPTRLCNPDGIVAGNDLFVCWLVCYDLRFIFAI